MSQLQQRSKSSQATGAPSRAKDLEPEVEDSSNLNHAANEWPTHESPKFVESVNDTKHEEKEFSEVGIGGTVAKDKKDTVDPAFDRFESFDIAHNDGEEDTEPIVIQPLTR